MDKLIAKREYGTAYEMSEKNRTLPFQIEFTSTQFEKLKSGLIPIEMGDRWFIFFENSILHFHMWSGECIYKLSIIESKSGIVKTDKIQIVNDITIKPIKSDVEEINELKSLLKYSLLEGEEAKFTAL